MLSHEYFEPWFLIIIQVLLMQSELRYSVVFILCVDDTSETSHWENVVCSHSDKDFAKTGDLDTQTGMAVDGNFSRNIILPYSNYI